jgi:ABC-type multidrug transport system fused ATPase/permease subunit
VQRSLGVLNTVQRFIFGSGLTFNMILAAYYTQKGLLTTGDIIMIQTLMLQFLNPLFILGSMYRSFEDNLIDLREVKKIMLTPCNVKEGEIKLENIRGHVQLRDVVFRYMTESSDVLTKINLTVKENSFVAIVGRSGIGKTTILNLIFRLYDPISGDVMIDGVNIRDLTFDFRKHLAFVSQTPYLFNGTVM